MEKTTFAQLYEDNYKALYNYVYMRLLHRQEAEDIVSDVFMKALDAYDTYDPAVSSERTWLFRIAKNRLTDYYRRRAINPVQVMEDEALSAIPGEDRELEAIQDDTNRIVYCVLKELRDEEREILLMRYIQGLKNPEIARELGIAEKAVSERIRRALAKCRKIMEEMPE